MTNRQAVKLRPGSMVRCKEPFERRDAAIRREVFVVERVARASDRSDDVTVYAGGHAFKAWEIERVMQGAGVPAGQ